MLPIYAKKDLGGLLGAQWRRWCWSTPYPSNVMTLCYVDSEMSQLSYQKRGESGLYWRYLQWYRCDRMTHLSSVF